MTWAPELRRRRARVASLPPVRGRGLEFSRVPRPTLPLRSLRRPALPRPPSFLFSPIACSILPVLVIDPEIRTARVLHPQLLGGERPDPSGSGQLRDPNPQLLPLRSDEHTSELQSRQYL